MHKAPIMAAPSAGPRPMISMFAAPRQNCSSSLRSLNTESRTAQYATIARSASACHARPSMWEASTIDAAVALVYVFVALPYSGPAMIGSLIWVDDQQALFSLLQTRAIGLPLLCWHNCTSSALSPEVVSSTETAVSSQTGRA